MNVDPVLLTGLRAIEPYLGNVVVAGGWVPYLYSLIHPPGPAGLAPRTRDIDVAVPRKVPLTGPSIDTLLEDAGFRCECRSHETPPVTKYIARTDDGGDEVEVEFITDAPGNREGAVLVQGDTTALEMHYVGLMLVDPWVVDLADVTLGETGLRIQVPSPGAFILHKGLVFRVRRDRRKKEKDLYYAFYVLAAFPWAGSIRAELRRLAQNAKYAAWMGRALKDLRSAFGSVDSPGVDAIVAQKPEAAYRDLDPDQFRQYAWGVMSDCIEILSAAVPGE